MVITAGTFGYGFIDIFLNSPFEIAFYLPFAVSEASKTDEFHPSSSLASVGVSTHAGTLTLLLTFEILVEACPLRDSWRFKWTLPVLSG